jgi:predicted TIM-barrel fold metal-dependent hydrolase
VSGYTIIDADTHVTETPDLWTSRAPASMLFTGEPQYFGQPLLGDPHWNPLWQAAVEFDLPISFHVGSGDMTEGLLKNRVAAYGQAAAFTALAINILFQNGMQVSDLIMSGLLTRYPQIKFVSVESGIGWIPFMLETMDYQFQGNSVAEERPEFDRLPSEYFARNVYACYWFEQTAPRRLLDKIGVDNILFETDFPHPTSLYGDEVHARIKAGLADCAESDRRKILWGNAEKLYKVTPPSPADEAAVASRGA